MNPSKRLYLAIVVPTLLTLLAACAAPAAPAPAPTNAPAPATATTAPAAPGPTAAPASAASGAGAMKYVLVPAKSEASYAVREQLARLNFPSDAIGKTSAVSGTVVVNADGTIDTANSKFVVDATTLKTDQAMRDNYVARNILQSNQYPQIVFVPKQVSGLPSPIPQSGSVTFDLGGDLTIRDVTQPVTWTVNGTLNNGEAAGTALTHFTFEDFSLTPPKLPMLLSVGDIITLTVKVDIQPAGQ